MIKIIFSEVKSPISAEDSIDLNHSSCVRAVNVAKTSSIVNLFDPITGEVKSLTISGGESVVLKKTLSERVYSSSQNVRISGVSIY